MKTEEYHEWTPEEWTPEEITFLRENWQKLTYNGIPSSIGIKELEVRSKRRELVLKGRKVRQKSKFDLQDLFCAFLVICYGVVATSLAAFVAWLIWWTIIHKTLPFV